VTANFVGRPPDELAVFEVADFKPERPKLAPSATEMKHHLLAFVLAAEFHLMAREAPLAGNVADSQQVGVEAFLLQHALDPTGEPV
jgi:hypothetical protein